MSASTSVLNAKGAIARHIQWRISLQFAIRMQEPLSESQLEHIRHYRRCAIGLWLESPATLPMRSHPAYLDLVHRHIDFHFEMQHIANCIALSKFDVATRAIAAESSFSRSSNALAMAVTAYDRIATIAVPVQARASSSYV
jgi:hypothetical protein